MAELSEMKMPALRAIAKQRGLSVPVGTTKVALVALLEAAPEQQPAPGEPCEPSPDDVTPDTATPPDPPQEDAQDAPSGHREERRPITEVSERGDWTDPFSGLRVYHATKVCAQSGARREGNDAVLLVREGD